MPLIAANDSHYIYPEQIVQRKQLQVGKNISYKDEDEFLLDYPDIDTFFRRFQDQNVLSYNQISTAIENTLIFDDCEDIELDYEVKMPSIYKHLTEDEKIKELKNIINVKFPIVMKQDGIDKEHRKLYAQEIRKEMQVIEDTKSLHTADYFLFNNKMVELAVNKHGGTLTRSGRGSGGAFLINKILGITQIDRLDVFLPIYSERFMSTSRLLENKASPDIDYNCATQEPFVKAMRELLGEKNCYPMLAYGTMKLSEAFRNVCRSKNLDYEEYNEIAKKIDEEIPSGKWEEIVKEAKNYIGTIINASVHPCAFLLLNEDIESEIGVVRIGDAICAMITSGEADEYKYLKNDILVVTVWDIISQVFKEINKPILSVKELKENLTPEIWELLAQGYTATLNQVDGDWATSMLMQYKPKSIEELSMFVGAIRPSFENFRETFLKRQPYTTGSEELDQLFSQTNHFIIFQENLMQYFEWLGVSPAESIGLIKKISKKKIKPQDFESLEKRLETQWIKNTGSIDKFHETWQSMQAMMNYGFNCLSGKTKLFRSSNGKYTPTIEEMWHIANDLSYAKKTNHMSLRQKYRSNGFGSALSMSEDGRIRENKIVSISYAGVRQTYKLTTETGREIICTDNHKFPNPTGKKMLKDLKVGDEVYVMGEYEKCTKKYTLTDGNCLKNYPKKNQQGFQKMPFSNKENYDGQRITHISNADYCEICGCEYSKDKHFELHHKDFNRQNNTIENFQWLCASCHKKIHFKHGRVKKYEKGIPAKTERIVSIEYQTVENVYDVSMEAPNHNFVVESGIVTSNSPHGLATALDCLYGAYLKQNYPLQYYTTVLNIYQDNQTKVSSIEAELPHFHIKMHPIKFGRSRAQYSYDIEENAIYKGVASLKYFNHQAAEDLYTFSQTLTGNETFVDLLYKIKETIKIDSRKMTGLIVLNYFSYYGSNQKLLKIYHLFEELYGKSTLSKEKLSKYNITPQMLSSISAKETKKQYSNINMHELLNLLSSSIIDVSLDLQTQISYEIEYLGSPISTYDCPLNNYIITDLEIRYSTPIVTMYELNKGETVTSKVDKKISYKNKECLLNKMDIISIPKIDKKNKFKKNDDGTFTMLDTTENIIKHFVLVKRFEKEK